MKQKLQQWLTHNLLLKIIALVMAILLWLAFSNEEDPTIQASFTIPVSVQHLEEFRNQNHYIDLEGEDDLSSLTLNVYIQARRSVVEQLQTRPASSFLRAYVDLYELDEGTGNRLMIHYEITDSAYASQIQFYELKNKSYYEANVDDNISKEIEVRYEIQGSPDQDYMYVSGDEEIQVNPETITLTGPASQIEKIAYGKVTIRIDGVTANVNKKGDIALFDEDDDQIINYSRDIIKASSTEASVFVPIYMVKTVPVQPYLTGTVPEGYEYGKDVNLSVSEITIYGAESILNKITSIALPKVDLADITEDYEITYDLNEILNKAFPKDAVKILNDDETSTTLTFTVDEQKSKIITIQTSNITVYGLRNGWSYTFSSPSLEIELVGLEKNIWKFDESAFAVSIRLKEEDFTEGKHQIAADVTGLGDLNLKNSDLTVEVVLAPKS